MYFQREEPPIETETIEVQVPRGVAKTEPHRGKNPRAGVKAFIALLLLSLLAGGAWGNARAAEDGTSAKEAYRAEQPAGKDASPAQPADLPVVRPRGLPRRTGHTPARRWNRGRIRGRDGFSKEAGLGGEPRLRALPGEVWA